MTRSPALIGTDLDRAARLLRDGGLVAFGTETVYGLGANAFDESAVARIFEAKGRPRFDPLIVHVADALGAKELVTEWPTSAQRLAAAFWPGPLTLVLPKRPLVPGLVTSGLPAVGLRVPGLEVTRQLLARAGCPVAAPSANPFGMTSPTTAAHVAEQLADRVDYVVDTGPCDVGVESTVVRVIGEDVTLLRPGGVTREQLESVVGPVRLAADAEKGEMQTPDSPGQLPKHYAPRVPLRLGRPAVSGPRDGLLQFARPVDDWGGPVISLSTTGDLVEAATRLFAAMRELAAEDIDVIYVDDIPKDGLGLAINDRLRRAAAS